MIYYNSEIKDYFDLYSKAKKAIKSWNYEFYDGWRIIPANDVVSLFSDEYEVAPKQYLINQISNLLPEGIIGKLDYLKETYTQKDSNLDWLWQ
jgi:hypothetical protein